MTFLSTINNNNRTIEQQGVREQQDDGMAGRKEREEIMMMGFFSFFFFFFSPSINNYLDYLLCVWQCHHHPPPSLSLPHHSINTSGNQQTTRLQPKAACFNQKPRVYTNHQHQPTKKAQETSTLGSKPTNQAFSIKNLVFTPTTTTS